MSKDSIIIQSTITTEIVISSPITKEIVIQSPIGVKTFCTEFQKVYDYWTTKPSDVVATALNLMVEGWVNSGFWDSQDFIFNYAIHTNDNGEALIEWKNPGTRDATLVNTPTFTPFEGFQGDGATQYIDLNHDLSIHSVNYQLNDSSLGLYVRTNVDENRHDIGVGNAALPSYAKIRTRVSNSVRAYINSDLFITSAVTDSRGMTIATRTSPTAVNIFRNNVHLRADSKLTNIIPTGNVYCNSLSFDDLPFSYSNKQISLVFGGGSLGQVLVSSATDDFEAYMDSNGKGVIP